MSKICLIYIFVIVSLSSAKAGGLTTDSLNTNQLKEVKVKAQRTLNTRATMPIQQFSEKEITQLNANNITDVAKHFSGITVKDYGGIGGMKTVCLRGFSAQHTGVSYDGIMLSDIQTGQIDLGRFSLTNISEISLSNAQPNDIFQSARMFASAGVICLTTKLPEFDATKTLTGMVSAKTGSFGLANTSLFITKMVNKKWLFNLSADGTVANGRFSFLQNYNSGNANGVKQTLTRENSDIQSIRAEANVVYRIHPKESLSLKTNYFNSERGLPGAVTFYNSYSRARLWDKVFFAQLHYENKSSEKFQTQYSVKYNRADNRFRNFNSSFARPTNPEGLITENYIQGEYYASAAVLYRPIDKLTLSAAADGWYNELNINRPNGSDSIDLPTQQTGLVNLAAKYTSDRWTIGANLLYTQTHNEVQKGIAAPNRSKLSPTASVSYKLLPNKELRIRAFYKNIFRVPTFNDLYFQDMGNKNLKPEATNQYNVGLVYRETVIPLLSELELSADAYYNDVTDKIIALPKDLFHWSMANKGSVTVKGVDVTLKAIIPLLQSDKLMVRSNYSYQKAVDATTSSANFGEQIPYSPLNSGSGSLTYLHRSTEFGYNLLFSGQRWSGQNIRANRLNSYVEHSVFATAYFKKLKVTGEIINLLNTQYEVVQFFPMPRRNFRLTATINF
ncbi:MAG: TonB-dependent receptor [Bacteroidales bacterium]